MAKKSVAKKSVKSVKMSASDMRKQFEKEIAKGLKAVEKEAVKIRRQADAAVKQADTYIRKNPEKAVAIASGIAAALGAASALIATHAGKKGKK
ncbi:MAG TPA: hypothetical protein VN420_05460 [Candidatus Fimivivens sp.]|nr:hypothetical protein [Candidatus Fimivivens sp.]